MRIGIVSYLPNDERREARLVDIRRQLDFIKRTFPDFYIVTVAQCYRDEDLQPEVDRYIRFDKPIGPGGARNELLKEFYNSDEDFMLLMDDDLFLQEHYDGAELIRMIDRDPSITNLDLIGAINPRFGGFKAAMIENQEHISKFFTFKGTPYALAFSVIRNLKKYHGVEKYVLDAFKNGSNEMHEDQIFVRDMINDGFRCTNCQDWIIRSDDRTSVAFDVQKVTDYSEHDVATKNTQAYCKEHFYDKVGGQAKWSRQCNVLRGKYEELDIPRTNTYKLTANELDYKTRKRQKNVEE